MLEILLVVIVVLLFLYYGVPLLYMSGLRVRLTRRGRRRRQLVLTFDDGPGNHLTARVLDLLRKNNGKATFFLLGRNIAGREDLVRRIAAEGHEIGAHGFDHLHYWKVGPLRSIADIRRGWSAVDQALGRQGGAYPFRPPYGKVNLACLIYLWMRHVPIVYWTYDSGDTWPPDRREAQWARLPGDVPDGAVVLMHDFDRTGTHVDGMVIDVVQRFLDRTAEKGIGLSTISDFLRDCRAQLD